MKKSSRNTSQNRKKRQAAVATTTSAQPEPNRRAFLSSAMNWGIGLTLLGGAGFGATAMVRSTAHAHDLTRVANGRPTVVQIHDSQCTLCAALQRETKRALREFDSAEIDYVIANITSAKGRTFAARYGVRHVTLLLFEADGTLKEVLVGQQDSAELREVFQELVAG